MARGWAEPCHNVTKCEPSSLAQFSLRSGFRLMGETISSGSSGGSECVLIVLDELSFVWKSRAHGEVASTSIQHHGTE